VISYILPILNAYPDADPGDMEAVLSATRRLSKYISFKSPILL
jgi:hypothetical protein